MKPGYYWVKFPSDDYACIGYFNPKGFWEFVGTDEPIEVGPGVEILGEVETPRRFGEPIPVGR